MIISVDGPVGSGKTTLVSHLAPLFDGVDFKYSGVPEVFPVEGSPVSLTDFLAMSRRQLRVFFDDTEQFNADHQTNAIFLFNLMRLVCGRAHIPMRASPYIFIDTFWDPLWVMEPQCYNAYYEVMCRFMPAPNVSIFLKVDEETALRRANARDPEMTHEPVGKVLQEKRDSFLKWAFDNIPNFYRIRADVPSSEVLKEAQSIIKEVERCQESSTSQTNSSRPAEKREGWEQKPEPSTPGQTEVSTTSKSGQPKTLNLPKWM